MLHLSFLFLSEAQIRLHLLQTLKMGVPVVFCSVCITRLFLGKIIFPQMVFHCMLEVVKILCIKPVYGPLASETNTFGIGDNQSSRQGHCKRWRQAHFELKTNEAN